MIHIVKTWADSFCGEAEKSINRPFLCMACVSLSEKNNAEMPILVLRVWTYLKAGGNLWKGFVSLLPPVNTTVTNFSFLK